MSRPYSNNEDLTAIRQAGVIINGVFDYQEFRRRGRNGNPLIGGDTQNPSTFSIHNKAICLRPKRNPTMFSVRSGGSIKDKDLVPVQAVLNGIGTKGNAESVYSAYEFVGVNIHNDVAMTDDNVQTGDSFAMQAHGVVTVPHQGPDTIQAGSLVQWAVPASKEEADRLHQKFIGRPQQSVFAYWKPYENASDSMHASIVAAIRGGEDTTEQDRKAAALLLRAIRQVQDSSDDPTELAQDPRGPIPTFLMALLDLGRQSSDRVVAIALNTAAPGDNLDLFLFPSRLLGR